MSVEKYLHCAPIVFARMPNTFMIMSGARSGHAGGARGANKYND